MNYRLPLDLLSWWRVYGDRVKPETPEDYYAKTSRRSVSASGILPIGVGGLALCCALPSLLAGGALAAAAGWGRGVWAAIVVSALALGVWLLRRRERHHASSSIDPNSTMTNIVQSKVEVGE